jgi:hypothetical protein
MTAPEQDGAPETAATTTDFVVAPNALKSLAAGLRSAQRAAASVTKDARNSHHGYRYASAEAILAEVKEPLAAHGLALMPTAFRVEAPSDPLRAAGVAAMLHSKWVLEHVCGETREIECDWFVVPDRGRPIDKALAAARTASLSYLLRDVLQLPRVEEGTGLDDDSRDPPVERRGPKRAHTPARGTSDGSNRPPRRALSASLDAARADAAAGSDLGNHVGDFGDWDSLSTEPPKAEPPATKKPQPEPKKAAPPPPPPPPPAKRSGAALLCALLDRVDAAKTRKHIETARGEWAVLSKSFSKPVVALGVEALLAMQHAYVEGGAYEPTAAEQVAVRELEKIRAKFSGGSPTEQ